MIVFTTLLDEKCRNGVNDTRKREINHSAIGDAMTPRIPLRGSSGSGEEEEEAPFQGQSQKMLTRRKYFTPLQLLYGLLVILITLTGEHFLNGLVALYVISPPILHVFPNLICF